VLNTHTRGKVISESEWGSSNVWLFPGTIDIVRENASTPICHTPESSPRLSAIPAKSCQQNNTPGHRRVLDGPTPDFYFSCLFNRTATIQSRVASVVIQLGENTDATYIYWKL
jgi:hypothetical protein